MSDNQEQGDLAVGRHLAMVREEAGLTQAQLAAKVTFSPASISRIESGDKALSPEEFEAMLRAIGTPMARQLGEFAKQKWDVLDRPDFDHPNRESLWSANQSIRKLRKLRENPKLKNVFVRQIDLYEKEIRRIAKFLQPCKHRIAFIGSIGVGKSTAICKLAGLLKPGQPRLEREIVLDTGAGGTTICQVHIRRGPQYGLWIEPRSESSIRKDVEDFAEYLLYLNRGAAASSRPEGGEDDSPGISKEVERAIRNMSDLVERKHKDEAGKWVRTDPAREVASKYTRTDDLAIDILTRMDLSRRRRTDAWYVEDSGPHPMQWLWQIFSEVNNGRNPEFTLPQKIEVLIPQPVFSEKDYCFEIIDTRGVSQDAYAARQDLESHFDDPRTLVVLCSTFFQAPEQTVQTLLRRAKEAGLRDIEAKTVVLVLPHDVQVTQVKDNSGSYVESKEEGYDLKRDAVNLALAQMGLGEMTVLFFNAKEDQPESIRNALVAKVTELRRIYGARITQLSQAVDLVIENYENEKIRDVFDAVNHRLSGWIEERRGLEWDGLLVQEPLLTAINNTRYAATVRAAVRRYGEWTNLDYYHHLGFGARRIAVSVIGAEIEDFRKLVEHLQSDDQLEPARVYLGKILERVENAVGEAYKRMQSAGREVFKTDLQRDYEFWNRCHSRWGQGSGYRTAIRDFTEEQLRESHYEDARDKICQMIRVEWEKLVQLLDEMIRDSESQNSGNPSVALNN
jgi:transcriptional regulator with XRE-family HTH domain